MESNQNKPDIHFFELIGDQAMQVFFIYEFSTSQFYYANAAFNAVLRRNTEDILTNPGSLLRIIHQEDKAYVVENYQQFLIKKLKTTIEFRILWPDNSDRWIRLWVYPILQENQMRFAVGIAEDDSDRKKNLYHMEKINAKKNSILEILSHDLAGPLGTIQNLSQLIEKNLSLTDNKKVIEWAQLIQEMCKRNIALIRDFVKQEFLESANVELIKVRVDLVWEIGEVIKTYKQSQKDIEKVFELSCSHDKIYAHIDSMKFIQVINNLISNAIKFTYDNGIIHIHMEQKSETVLISVSDNGIGIPVEYHPYLFDKFTKARRAGIRGEESVGLGMSIIKTIVELHSGKIWFESEENKGVTFYIEIPQ